MKWFNSLPRLVQFILLLIPGVPYLQTGWQTHFRFHSLSLADRCRLSLCRLCLGLALQAFDLSGLSKKSGVFFSFMEQSEKNNTGFYFALFSNSEMCF